MCYRKKIFLPTVLTMLLSALCFTEISAGIRASSTPVIGKNEVSGKLRRLTEDIDDLERKMRNTDMNSPKGISQMHERCQLALEVIHHGQRMLLSNSGSSKKMRNIKILMDREYKILLPTLKKIKKFPGADLMLNVEQLLKAVRSGKIVIDRKISNSDGNLLQGIQKEQRSCLNEYFKDLMRNRRR